MRDPGSTARHPRPFPPTDWSMVRAAGDAEGRRESLDRLCTVYWRPVYAYLRRKWSKKHEEARDITQDFFAALCEKDVLGKLGPEHGRFRSYVMTVIDHFVVSRHRRSQRVKHGGGREFFSLEIDKGFEPAAEGTPEEVFHREWARAVLTDALRQLEKEGRERGNTLAYEIVRLRDVDVPPDEDLSYRALSKRFGIKESDVTNHLFRGRRRLRELVLLRVRDTLTDAGDSESEMRLLFGRKR